MVVGFKGSKDQRINRPPKAATKGSIDPLKAAAKGSTAAKGGSQRINQPPKAGRRAKDQPVPLRQLAAAKGSNQLACCEGSTDGASLDISVLLRRDLARAYHYVMAYHHKLNGNPSGFSGTQRTVCVSRAPYCSDSPIFDNVARLLKLTHNYQLTSAIICLNFNDIVLR